MLLSFVDKNEALTSRINKVQSTENKANKSNRQGIKERIIFTYYISLNFDFIQFYLKDGTFKIHPMSIKADKTVLLNG